MTQAYSVQQVAGLLGASTEATRLLVGSVLGGPRDILSPADLSLVQDAFELRQRGAFSARPVGPSVKARRGGEDPMGDGAAEQGSFDFGPAARRGSPRRLMSQQDAEVLFSRAVQLEEGDVYEALHAYGEALAADPRHADAHVNRGRLLHQLGELREAEAHYVAALVARPTDATATFNLAVVLEDLGRIDEAIDRYHQAIEIDARCVDAYFNLARLYERKGEKMAAIRHLKDYKRLVARRS
jgi:tetratricopeptide (TPR) repeat protein